MTTLRRLILNLLIATAMLISLHHTEGKHIALAKKKKKGKHMHMSQFVCVQEKHENKMPGQLPTSTACTDSPVSIHQASGRKEKTTRVSLHRHSNYITNRCTCGGHNGLKWLGESRVLTCI